MNQDSTVSQPALDEVDRARAQTYALLARLFCAPPDAALLRAIVDSDEPAAEATAAPLALAWNGLKQACAASSDAAAREEYDSVFVGTGKAEVTLYHGAYVPHSEAGSYVVDLRAFLAAHGLARRDSVKEPEDHIAAVLEIMRHLIVEARADIDEQKAFFNAYVWTGAAAVCDAICACAKLRLYHYVARYARSFLELEHSAFEIG